MDFGSKRIGIAICDSAGLVATPHETIKRIGDEKMEHGRIGEIVQEIGATTVVVGHPIDLEGVEGHAARMVAAETRRLAKRVRPAEVVLQDERLTTVTADRSLRLQGVRRPARSLVIDQLAAATLLQTWLDGLPALAAPDAQPPIAGGDPEV